MTNIKNNQCPHQDAFGNTFKVGDMVLVAKNGDMQPAYVLGWADKSIVVSCLRKTKTYSNIANSTYVGRTRDVSDHNSKQNIAKWWNGCNGNMYIMSSGNVIPENLQKFIKRAQL